MVTVEAVQYIKNQIAKGLTQEQIQSALLASGWQLGDIQEAFRLAQSGVPVISSTGSSELPGPIALLHEAWEIYKHLFWKFVSVGVLSVVIIGLVFLLMVSGFVIPGWAFFSPVFIIEYIVILFLFGCFVGVVTDWEELVDIELMKDSQEYLGVFEAVKRSLRILIPFVWVQILLGVLITSGSLSLGIPGLLFAVWFIFAPFIVVSESEHGMRALLKSREYVRGRFSAVSWRLLFIGIIAFVFQVLIKILQSIGGKSTNGTYSGGVSSVLVGAVSLILEIAVVLSAPIIVTYIFVLYRHLRAVKGPFAFNPTTKQKAKYFLSLLGWLIFFVPVILIALLAFQKIPHTIQHSPAFVPSIAPSPQVLPTSTPIQLSPTPVFQIQISSTPTPSSLPVYQPVPPATSASGLGSSM